MSILDVLSSVMSSLGGNNDGGCDWTCDECGTYMNGQPGFSVLSGSWCCKECGSWNDVSENNITNPDEVDNGYFGSCDYYRDEERRLQEERDDLLELGIDPDD